MRGSRTRWARTRGLVLPLACRAARSTEAARAQARDAAVRRAEGADAIIAVVGEPPYAEASGQHDNRGAARGAGGAARRPRGDTASRSSLVVIAGRPLMMGPQLDGAAAALMAYLPGTQGGRAVADALFGRVNPSGRLSVTWPKSVGSGYRSRTTGCRASPTIRATRSGTGSATPGSTTAELDASARRGRRAGVDPRDQRGQARGQAHGAAVREQAGRRRELPGQPARRLRVRAAATG